MSLGNIKQFEGLISFTSSTQTGGSAHVSCLGLHKLESLYGLFYQRKAASLEGWSPLPLAREGLSKDLQILLIGGEHARQIPNESKGQIHCASHSIH